MKQNTVAVAGANGYVGRHLIPELFKKGWKIKALVRRENPYTTMPYAHYVKGDCETGEGLLQLLEHTDVAYYLVHSLEMEHFLETEIRCARNFIKAAQEAGVKRIIYLSGLIEKSQDLSPHLLARKKVGEVFHNSPVETIELRTSAIFGAGSTSYEIISSLVERLPIMTLPRWVFNRTQPISVADILFYLVASADRARSLPSIIEVGGRNVVSYREMMICYAKARGLKRIMIPVPFLSLNLSSWWLHLITPVHAKVGRALIASIRNNTVVSDNTYRELFHHHPLGIEGMIEYAIMEEQKELLSPQKDHLWRFDRAKRVFGRRFGRYIVRRDDIIINASPKKVFQTIENIGGENGWYFCTILWKMRSALDKMIGGPGFSLGKSSLPLRIDDPIDCWYVENIVDDQLLLLRSAWKMPGDAHLEFELVAVGHQTLLYQTALFRPKGLFGSIYWYFLYPIHIFLFKGLLQAIKKKSEPKIKISIIDFLKGFLGIREEENPRYRVLLKEGNKEIREYEPFITATLNQEKNGSPSDSKTFMRLARYIFGGNHPRKNIPMTAPVMRESLKDRGISMTFIMPKNLTWQDLPIPDDSGIRLEQQGPQIFAIISYSGRSSKKDEERYADELKNWLAEHKEYSFSTEYLFAGFDPPWTLGPLRKNEIMVRLSHSPLL